VIVGRAIRGVGEDLRADKEWGSDTRYWMRSPAYKTAGANGHRAEGRTPNSASILRVRVAAVEMLKAAVGHCLKLVHFTCRIAGPDISHQNGPCGGSLVLLRSWQSLVMTLVSRRRRRTGVDYDGPAARFRRSINYFPAGRICQRVVWNILRCVRFRGRWHIRYRARRRSRDRGPSFGAGDGSISSIEKTVPNSIEVTEKETKDHQLVRGDFSRLKPETEKKKAIESRACTNITTIQEDSQQTFRFGLRGSRSNAQVDNVSWQTWPADREYAPRLRYAAGRSQAARDSLGRSNTANFAGGKSCRYTGPWSSCSNLPIIDQQSARRNGMIVDIPAIRRYGFEVYRSPGRKGHSADSPDQSR